MWLVNEPGIAIDIPCEQFDIPCEQAIPRWEPHAKLNGRRIASTLCSAFYASRLLKQYAKHTLNVNHDLMKNLKKFAWLNTVHYVFPEGFFAEKSLT